MVVVRTRPYDETFYAEIGDVAWEEKSDEECSLPELAKADLGFFRAGVRFFSSLTPDPWPLTPF